MRLQHSLALIAVGCGSGGGFPDAAPATGTFSVMWSVNDVTSGLGVPCDQVGATMVEAATSTQGAQGPTENFICGQTQGQSEGFVPGIYDIGFTLTSVGGDLATAPAQNGVRIVGGQNTQLQPVTFTIDATGNMSLSLATGMASNCTGGGRAMQTVSIAVEHASNSACAPMTLDIAQGTTSGAAASTYVVDAACSRAVHACIENDQAITAAMPFASGRYAFSVRGQIAGHNCWAADAVVQIPALGGITTQTVTMTYNMLAGCP